MYISKVFEAPEATLFKKHFENVSMSMWFQLEVLKTILILTASEGHSWNSTLAIISHLLNLKAL